MSVPSPTEEPALLVHRAFVDSPTDFLAWSRLWQWLKPSTDRIADADVERRLGPVAKAADRAEARDLIWRAVVGERGAGLRAWDGREPLPAHVEDRARACVRVALRVMDLRLVQRWTGGDARAGNQLERRLRAVIHARVRRVLAPAGWRAEAVAEAGCDAWLRVLPAIHRWHPHGGMSLENWVGQQVERGARSALRDARAEKRRGVEVPLSAVARHPADEASPEEEARRRAFARLLLDRAQGALSSTQLAVVGDDLDGLSLDELCRRHGVSANFVYKARARLKQVWCTEP